MPPYNQHTTYLLVINGKPEGPFTIEQLKDHHIKPGDFVKTAEMDDFKEAHEVARLCELFGFTRQALIPQYFGSFDQRLLASALDWFFVLTICVPVAFLISIFIANGAVRLVIAFSLLFFVPFIKLVYHITMECSARQATFGKQIIGIKVCDMQGKRLNITHSAGRNLAKIFSVLTFFIGYLFIFFNKKQQCLHDVLAGTLVMKDRLF